MRLTSVQPNPNKDNVHNLIFGIDKKIDFDKKNLE